MKRHLEPQMRQGHSHEENHSPIWNSLDALRAELLKMEHRLDWACVGNETSPFAVVDNMSTVSLPQVQNTTGVEHVDATLSVNGAQTRVDEKENTKSDKNSARQLLPHSASHANVGFKLASISRQPVNVIHDHHEIKKADPGSGDFPNSQPTQQAQQTDPSPDSKIHPVGSRGNGNNLTINSTYTNIHDILETEIHFLNFSSAPSSDSAATRAPVSATSDTINNTTVPFSPPQAESNPASQSSLILSSHPNGQAAPQQAGYENKGFTKLEPIYSRTRIEKPHTKRGCLVKLIQVGPNKAGLSRTNHSTGQLSTVEQKHAELLHVRKQFEEKWAGVFNKNNQHREQCKSVKGVQKMDKRKDLSANAGDTAEDQPEVIKVKVPPGRRTFKPLVRSTITPSSWRAEQKDMKKERFTRTKSKSSSHRSHKVTFSLTPTEIECARDTQHLLDRLETCSAEADTELCVDDAPGKHSSYNPGVDEMWINAGVLSANARSILSELI